MLPTFATSLFALQLAAAGPAAAAQPPAPPTVAVPAPAPALAAVPSPAPAPSAAAVQLPTANPARDRAAAQSPATSASTTEPAAIPADWAEASRPSVANPSLVRAAVRDALAAERAADHEAPDLHRYGSQPPPDRYQVFADQFDDARVPDCLHAQGLKRQPTSIGPFGVGGLLALPFVAIAKLRGKCN